MTLRLLFGVNERPHKLFSCRFWIEIFYGLINDQGVVILRVERQIWPAKRSAQSPTREVCARLAPLLN
jgi:hypothetical protein